MVSEHGTKHFLDDHIEDHIDAYWGSYEEWQKIPTKESKIKHFKDWNHVIHIDHGYDENQPESELSYNDMVKAVKFRGGELLSKNMKKGDWSTPLHYRCAFSHEFTGSPRLILEGGHWCPVCEAKSWNYGQRAKVGPFFAQVWNPLHKENELREYPKVVSEEDVK